MRSVRVVPVRGRPTMNIGVLPVAAGRARCSGAPSASPRCTLSMIAVDQREVGRDVVVGDGGHRIAGQLVSSGTPPPTRRDPRAPCRSRSTGRCSSSGGRLVARRTAFICSTCDASLRLLQSREVVVIALVRRDSLEQRRGKSPWHPRSFRGTRCRPPGCPGTAARPAAARWPADRAARRAPACRYASTRCPPGPGSAGCCPACARTSQAAGRGRVRAAPRSAGPPARWPHRSARRPVRAPLRRLRRPGPDGSPPFPAARSESGLPDAC